MAKKNPCDMAKKKPGDVLTLFGWDVPKLESPEDFASVCKLALCELHGLASSLKRCGYGFQFGSPGEAPGVDAFKDRSLKQRIYYSEWFLSRVRACEKVMLNDVVSSVRRARKAEADAAKALTFEGVKVSFNNWRQRKLDSPFWQAVRAGAIEFAGERCSFCNAEGNLVVHHRTYERFGREDPSDVTVLCRECHDVLHEHVLLKKPSRFAAGNQSGS